MNNTATFELEATTKPESGAARSSDSLGVGKLEVWAYGGGTQSVGIAALIVQGKLPVPDWTVIADTEYERSSTWQYMNDVTVPAMEKVGVKIHRLLKSDYCYDHAGVFNSKGTPLIPAFTNQTAGNVGKLSGFCNRWWKQDVMLNFFRREHKLARSSMRKWIGYSLDESIRAIRMMDGDEWKSGLLRFPLIHDHPMKRRDTIAMVEAMGWPTPPRSACWMCPNQSDAEWRDLSNDNQKPQAEARDFRFPKGGVAAGCKETPAMSAHLQYEREEQDIHERLERGEISNTEAIKELNELQRDYRAAAREAAQSAYENELERW